MHFRIILSAVLSVLAGLPLFAQQPEDFRSATFDGTPGLFRTWDAEPILPGEVFFSGGVLRTHRDPGEITLTTGSGGLAIGLFKRFEIFGSWEIQKRVEAPGVLTYRIPAGEVSRPAQTLLGDRLFSSSAPFIDVPSATGRGDMYGSMKFGVLSETAGHPFALSAVGLGKLPGHKTFGGLNRGLTNGDTEVGFGVLASKRLSGGTHFHANGLWYFAGDPTIEGRGVSDLHHRFIFRGGAAIQVTGPVQVIGEAELYRYFGHEVPGLDPTQPVDLIFGLRVQPRRSVSISGGYLASVNRIESDPDREIRTTPAGGFVVQLGLALKRD